MKKTFLKIAFVFATIVSIASCSDNNQQPITDTTISKKDIITNYADIAYANYKQAYDDALALQTAIAAFTTTPTDSTFTIAKNAWKQSRESYGTTEAFRFANGPIDSASDANAPESLLNAWPLDENYIDYVDNNGTPTNSGIINETVLFPTITADLLISLNEDGGEKNISVGYHAIEFLLWGQDLTPPSANLPGQRPYTDYVDGGTAANQDRRRDYLNACAAILVQNLDYVVTQWQDGGAYRTTFLALPENEALTNMYRGMATLLTAELAVQRMEVALENQSQEDEHSCFSDNTHRDIFLNMQGVINIYQGKYGSIEGVSLQQLINQTDPTIGSETNASINDSKTKVAAIEIPFDLAIAGGPTSVEGMKVYAAAEQLKNFGQNLLAGATKIGLTVN